MSAATANYEELVEQSARLFENALKAGITVQQQSAKWFAETLRGLARSQWQTKGQAAAEQVMSVVQKQAEETIRNMTESAKSSMELLEKAFEVRQNDSAAEHEARNREIWESALGSLRKNTEAMVNANARVIESWSRHRPPPVRRRSLRGKAAGEVVSLAEGTLRHRTVSPERQKGRSDVERSCPRRRGPRTDRGILWNAWPKSRRRNWGHWPSKPP